MTAAAIPSIEGLFAALASRLGGDADRLAGPDMLALVERARGGDPAARRKLYTQYVDPVYRTVRAHLASDAEAEDVTQDALLAVLTHLHRYRPREGASFTAWVMTIALNTARRRFRRRRPLLTATGELPDAADPDLPDPDLDLDRARQRRALLQALAELTERDRAIVTLRYGAELNASEIAAQLHLSPANVRKLLERTRERLGERIDALLTPERPAP